MEHIAQTVKKDPIEVRINNMNKGDGVLLQMINELKSSSDYDARRQNIEAHNKASVFVCVHCAPVTKQLLLCVCVCVCVWRGWGSDFTL
jgi:xanthine dehydrogenase molybdopterin-binding subunit B